MKPNLDDLWNEAETYGLVRVSTAIPFFTKGSKYYLAYIEFHTSAGVSLEAKSMGTHHSTPQSALSDAIRVAKDIVSQMGGTNNKETSGKTSSPFTNALEATKKRLLLQ